MTTMMARAGVCLRRLRIVPNRACLLLALALVLGPAGAWGADPTPPKANASAVGRAAPRPLLTLYFLPFRAESYYAITPENVRRSIRPWHITDPGFAATVTDCLGVRGGAGHFEDQAVRLLAQLPDGRPDVLVDEGGVVRTAGGEYALPRPTFERLSALLEGTQAALRKAAWDAAIARRPALIRAAERDDVRAVKRLLAGGADVNVRDNFVDTGATALMSAAINGDDGLCRLLLAHGADVNAYGKDGLSALSWASMGGNASIDGVSVGKAGDTPHVSTMRLLLSRGARVRGKAGDYALDEAVYVGDASLASVLLRRGASLENHGFGGCTPLMTAIERGHSQLAERLLERGANANARDDEGETPLFLAARAGDVRLAAMLLGRGANVNAPNGSDTTPLMIAVLQGRAAMVRLLLARGASVSMHGDGDVSVLGEAKKVGKPAIAQMLLQAGAKE